MRKDVKWLVMGTFGVLAAHKTEDRSCVHAQIVTAGLAWAQVCFALSHTWAWLCSPLCDLGMSASGCVLLWDFYKNRFQFSEKRPAGGKIAPETRTFTKKYVIFSETPPAGGRIAAETRTFTKTDVMFQKNDPPEAR